MGKFKVAERFVSINGESRKAGELAVFIRFAGCNLNCSYCDTAWANEEKTPYEILSEEEIYDYIKRTGVRNVTLTGGEPLIQEDIDRLILMLSLDEDLSVEVETNGSIDIAEFKALTDNVSYTLDYKLPGSGMEDSVCFSNYNYIDKNDAVKFVAGSIEDLEKAKEIIYGYVLDDRTNVYISPVFGKITPEEIVDFMIENEMNKVKLQLQLHKYIWEPDTRGV
jgi:7-carboxy-7-deazaguanine synthase